MSGSGVPTTNHGIVTSRLLNRTLRDLSFFTFLLPSVGERVIYAKKLSPPLFYLVPLGRRYPAGDHSVESSDSSSSSSSSASSGRESTATIVWLLIVTENSL